MDEHVPSVLRAAAAATRGPGRAVGELHDLRHFRQPAGAQADARGAGNRSGAVHARADRLGHQLGQEQPDHGRELSGQGRATRWGTCWSGSIRPTRRGCWPRAPWISTTCCCTWRRCCARTPRPARRSIDRYRYILVDEYQDTNLAQYTIVRALSIDVPNLAVTGDPDQSIYGWRGANLSNILDFEHDYPNVRVVKLERNYRSTKRILRVADTLIQHNQRRKAKDLYTENDEGQRVRLVAYANQQDEAESIAARIAESVRAGQPAPARFCHLLSRQRPVAGVRVRPARPGRAVSDGQRAGVLSAPRNQGHAGVSAPAQQSARRQRTAAGHQHAAARHRQEHDRANQRARRLETDCRCWTRRANAG